MRPLCLGIAQMKAYMLITGSGPIVILTSHDSVVDAALIKKLASKGIEKFIATRFRSVLLKNAMVRISRLCRAMSGKPTISVCSTMTEAARSSCSGSMNSVRRCSTSRRHEQRNSCGTRPDLSLAGEFFTHFPRADTKLNTLGPPCGIDPATASHEGADANVSTGWEPRGAK